MNKLPMDKVPDFKSLSTDIYETSDPKAWNKLAGKPLLYETNFSLEQTGDCFLDMTEWGKGIVFVNGKNIRYYWSIGSQQTLYVPGVWLNKGNNSIVAFEQISNGIKTELKAIEKPILNQLKVQ